MPANTSGGESNSKYLVGGALTVAALSVGYFVFLQKDNSTKNIAFLFLKPHACNNKTVPFVKAELKRHGIRILEDGEISGQEIDENNYMDHHYYPIASKATLLEPKDIYVPSSVFEKKFGLPWPVALAQGNAYNAKQACIVLDISAEELNRRWYAAKDAGKEVRLGGGFYCAEIDGMYIFNGFFMSMRERYTGDARIHYFVVEFDSKKLKWADFRGSVIGATEPYQASPYSLRGMIASRWEEFGLGMPCDAGDNALHASASPFEGLVECSNWLECDIGAQPFGRLLQDLGIPETTIKAWSLDPQIQSSDGQLDRSLFDHAVDLDTEDCLARLKEIYEQKPKFARI